MGMQSRLLVLNQFSFPCRGYIAPEYIIYGNFSIQSDVYSFGVLVLEIISGQKNRLFNSDEFKENLLLRVNLVLKALINCCAKEPITGNITVMSYYRHGGYGMEEGQQC